MPKPLVWVPRGMSELVETAPDGLEISEAPEHPDRSDRLGDVEVVVVGPGDLSLAQQYNAMPNLKLVQTVTAGVDSIVPLVPAGVTLCSARGSYGIVAEWVVGAILSDYKTFPHYRDEQRRARWSPQPARRLVGASILIVGYGSIGEAVEERLRPFGTEFLRVSRTERPGVQALDALGELLPMADVVVLLVPLTPSTEGLVDAAFLARMKPDSLLVNAARGKVVDTAALIEALEAGDVRAALDVTDPEPLPDDHPLFSAPNVFITPHIAGGPLARAEVVAFLRRQLEKYSRGEPLANVVTEGY